MAFAGYLLGNLYGEDFPILNVNVSEGPIFSIQEGIDKAKERTKILIFNQIF